MPEYPNLTAPLSTNAKLGFGVATNYRPVGDSAKGEGTCPSTCPLLNNGCYAQHRLTRMNSQRSKGRFDDLERLLSKGASYVRLHTSGDFFVTDGEGSYRLDELYFNDILALVRRYHKVTFWAYCHDVTKLVDAGFSYAKGTIPANLHIVASCDNHDQRAYAKEHGFRSARVIETLGEQVKGETLCPYDYDKYKNKKRQITCTQCQLCFNPKHKHDIAFLKH